MSSPAARLGPYELLRRIGKGGMASVYLARQGGVEGFARPVAIKVMHPHLARDRELVDMLMDEARLAARLSHPNVVSTVDVGHERGTHFLAMDYVEGVALDRLLWRYPGARPSEVIVPIAIDALRGLAAAHALTGDDGEPLGLVHRDVTPGNVLVGLDGRARILDFGVAKARARITKTMPGIVKGKAGYVAPEVALGRAIDGRADVFSMGVLLWNALTGEKLFDTDDLAMSIRQLVSRDPPPPSEVGLMPPPLFDQPILTALRRDPDERHASAEEMAEALSDALLLSSGAPDHLAVGRWVEDAFGAMIDERRQLVAPAAERPRHDAVRDDPTADFRAKRRAPREEEGVSEGAPTEVVDSSALMAELEAPSLGAPSLGAPSLEVPSLTTSLPPPSTARDWADDAPPTGSTARTLLLALAAALLVLALGAAGLVAWRTWQTHSEPAPTMRATEL